MASGISGGKSPNGVPKCADPGAQDVLRQGDANGVR